MKIRAAEAEVLQADRRTDMTKRFSQFCERTYQNRVTGLSLSTQVHFLAQYHNQPILLLTSLRNNVIIRLFLPKALCLRSISFAPTV